MTSDVRSRLIPHRLLQPIGFSLSTRHRSRRPPTRRRARKKPRLALVRSFNSSLPLTLNHRGSQDFRQSLEGLGTGLVNCYCLRYGLPNEQKYCQGILSNLQSFFAYFATSATRVTPQMPAESIGENVPRCNAPTGPAKKGKFPELGKITLKLIQIKDQDH